MAKNTRALPPNLRRQAQRYAHGMREAIRAAMRRRKLTQLQLAELTGMSQPNLSDYLRGVQAINSDSLARIMAALDLQLGPRAED
jgi:transcriptional regulator with XRE-family HTH domain